MKKNRQILSILSVILLATWLRLAYLPTLPPGLNFDEAGNGVAALDLLQGQLRIWWTIGGGKEPLWPYIIALSTSLFGLSPLSLRLPAAFIGILTVAVSYPFMRAIFPARYGHWLGLLTALGIATSQWHIHFSRLGFRAILLPLLATLTFYFFWKSLGGTQKDGLNPYTPFFGKKNLIWENILKLSVLGMSLAVYSYLAARLLPLVLLIFITIFFFQSTFFSWRLFIRVKDTIDFLYRVFQFYLKYLTIYFFWLILFLLPLLIHFFYYPADFVARAGSVSIFSPEWNHSDLLGTAWQTLLTTLSTYVALAGDPNPLVNLPGQPAISVLLVPFFLLGFIVVLFSILINFRSIFANPYLFLLCWWSVMLLPAVLAPEGAPHHLRLIGTLVPTYAFVAIGFMSTVTICQSGSADFQPAADNRLVVLILTCYLLVLGQTCQNYFIHWPNQVDFTMPYDLYAVNLAEQIRTALPEAHYVIPMDIRAGEEARHYTLDYLLAEQSARYSYIPVDERNAEQVLNQTLPNHQDLYIVRWTADKHQAADEKEIVTFLLENYALYQGEETFPVYRLEHYQPSDATSTLTAISLPSIDQPIGANFDNLLRLDAAHVEPTAQSGDWLSVAITLAPFAPMEVDYKASLRLISADGERVAQKDRHLRHNFHQGTSLWPPETVNEYYLLPIPLDTPLGSYTVSLVIYHPDTQAPLVADGLVEVSLGSVEISGEPY
ncbi:glycosyltransferase family 39 protein [Anaerolineales bacterium HSG24]|nr:glycosyltransferase family 39 protein [Anaerolineales bacterium HSG24]